MIREEYSKKSKLVKNALTLLHQSIFFQNFSYNNTNLVKIKSANNISFWQERTKF